MQISDGSFGMWGPYAPAAEWLQGYVLDFLLRARDQQMAVPAASLQRGLTWLNRTVEQALAQRPGLCLVRARQGGPRRSRPHPLLPGHEGREIKDGLAWAQLAAALNQVGEPGRARLAFAWPASTSTSATPAITRLAAAQSRGAAGARGRGRRPRGRQRSRDAGARTAHRADRRHDHPGAGLAGAGRARDGRRRRARLFGGRRAAQGGAPSRS